VFKFHDAFITERHDYFDPRKNRVAISAV